MKNLFVIVSKIWYYIVSNNDRNPKYTNPESPDTVRSGEVFY
jgi:hypothetical protein